MILAQNIVLGVITSLCPVNAPNKYLEYQE